MKSEKIEFTKGEYAVITFDTKQTSLMNFDKKFAAKTRYDADKFWLLTYGGIGFGEIGKTFMIGF